MILLMLLSSLWSILIINYFEPFKQLKDKIGLGYERKLISGYKILDVLIYIIHKVINCPSCFSSHLFWILYLLINGSLYGLFLCPIVFFLTFLLTEKVLTIRL